MRVVHYLNQFFGAHGGEEAADMAPRIQDGAVGPGRLLEQVLGNETQIVHTIIAGDNYGAEQLETLTELVVSQVKAAQADGFRWAQRLERKADVARVVEEFVKFDGPAFLEVIIDPDAGVYPMVGPGQAYDEMITGEFIESRDPPKSTHEPGASEMF